MTTFYIANIPDKMINSRLDKCLQYSVYQFGIDLGYFSNDFVTDLTKTFVTKEYMTSLNTMHVFDAPSWLKKNVNRMCYAFGGMEEKIKFVERV